MTTPAEKLPITLDYLKGKRRAEKALGFLIDIGPRLLACDSPQQAAQAIAEHLLRLDIDLCMINLEPHAGSPVATVAQAPGLDGVPDSADIVERCRREAGRMALKERGPLANSDTTFDAGSSRVVLQQFTFHYLNIGSGALSVVRIRPDTLEFTSAELALLRDVVTRFLISVKCLTG